MGKQRVCYWGTLLACAEMIRSGTTTFADGYFFEDQAARAGPIWDAGILAQGILDFPTPDSPSPAESLKRMKLSSKNTCLFSHPPRPISPFRLYLLLPVY